MRRTTRLAALGLCVGALGVTSLTPAQAHPPTRTYEVTITLMTDGQPFTPPAVATHRGSVDVFEVGDPASLEVQEVAENGNLDPLLASLGDAQGVSDVQAAPGPLVPAGVPGDTMFDQSVTLTVEADRGARFLSWVSMLICTNDGFTGVDGLKLPSRVGGTASAYSLGYDAGTELNTEDFADIVPPCQGLVGVSSTDPGTGMTNPALAEGGVVSHHTGVAGGADLVPAVHGWDTSAPVAEVVVERVG